MRVFADGLRTRVYANPLGGKGVFAVFAVFADAHTRAHEGISMSSTLSGDEIRATHHAIAADVEARILQALTDGPCSTLDLVKRVSDVRGSRRDLIEGLARLVDEEKIIGTPKPSAPRDWLSSATWRLAV